MRFKQLITVLIVLLIGWLASRGMIGDHLPFEEWKLGGLVLHPFALIYAANGSAMISKTLRIPKL